jgi:NADPH:quinone reductase
VPGHYTIKRPAGLSAEVGAAAMIQGLTALTLIREAYPARAGEWALVHAAAGGTGQWLTRLLTASGVHVIATASSEAKREIARTLGAEVTLPSVRMPGEGVSDEQHAAAEKEFVDKVLEITGGKGVDAVLDGVGKDTFESSLQVVKRAGWLISFGNASGAVPPLAIA